MTTGNARENSNRRTFNSAKTLRLILRPQIRVRRFSFGRGGKGSCEKRMIAHDERNGTGRGLSTRGRSGSFLVDSQIVTAFSGIAFGFRFRDASCDSCAWTIEREPAFRHYREFLEAIFG